MGTVWSEAVTPSRVCAVKDDECRGVIDTHEICSRGSGGAGVPENQLALCRFHHRRFHNLGWHEFAQRYPRVAGRIYNARNIAGRITESRTRRTG